MTLAENIQNNKTKAKYFLGIIIAACIKEVIETIQQYLPEDTWWGDTLLVVTGYAVVGVSIIAPLIFGNDSAIEKVKKERKALGEANEQLREHNRGLTITNNLQAGILKENNYKPYKYEKKDDLPTEGL